MARRVVAVVGLMVPGGVLADQWGDLTYADHGSSIEITDCAMDVSGHVTIPDEITGRPVTGIGPGAFEGCTMITGVTIPGTVHTIRSRAFAICAQLTEVTVPEGVTRIEPGTFENCRNLTRIHLPDSLTEISYAAFFYCLNLAEVTMPDELRRIDFEAFAGCASLVGLTTSGRLQVNEVGHEAFEGCEKLATAMTISGGRSVHIREKAFYGCARLPSVTIADGVDSIGKSAFRGCSALTSLTIPGNVRQISEEAFYGCAGLVNLTIGEGVRYIQSSAFRYCSALTTVRLPASLLSIGVNPFRNCTSLTAIEVDAANAVFASVDGVLFNKSLTELIVCPGGYIGHYVIPTSVTSVATYAFYRCNGLTGATIPDGITAIPQSMFSNCVGLERITIPDSVTSIGNTAFYNCAGLTSIAMPDGITSIGNFAFWGCASLTEMTLPTGLTSLGAHACDGCAALTRVTIPGGLTSIASGAFVHCSALTTIDVAPANSDFSAVDGILFDKTRSTLIHCPGGLAGEYVIPATVTTVSDGAFASCPNLTRLVVPSSVQSIERLGDCPSLMAIDVDPANPTYRSIDGVLYQGDHLIRCPQTREGEFRIADGTAVVAHGAFTSCRDLTRVTIPSTVLDLPRTAFGGCPSLSAISVNPDNPSYRDLEGVLFNKHLTVLLICPEGVEGHFVIPEGVTTIENFAFRNCRQLTKVTMPVSLENIASFTAFENCIQLRDAVFVGDAPAINSNPFVNVGSGFSLSVFEGRTGFLPRKWPFPVVSLGEPSPLAVWSVSHGLPSDPDLSDDLSGDGVSLLTSYALDLDPRRNLAGSLPEAEHSGGQVVLRFFGGREDVTYTVLTSTNLADWGTDGLTLSAPDADGMRTATVDPAGASRRFLQLSFSR